MRIPERVSAELAARPVRLADVGARGGWQRQWREVGRYMQFIGFEPEAAEVARLRAGAAANEIFSDKALFSTPGEVTLHHTRGPATTSIYPPNRALLDRLAPWDDYMDVIATEAIEATTLDSALAAIGIDGLDFLKLDTQGSELEILKGAEATLAGGLFGIEVEVEFAPLYVGQPLFPDVHAYLVDRGYLFIDFPEVYTFGDFTFNRRGMRGYANTGALLSAWAGKLRNPGGAWRGAQQLLYADAVYFRDLNRYLNLDVEAARRRVFVGVFTCCVLSYYGYAEGLILRAEERGLVDGALAADLRRMVVRLARSWSRRFGDTNRFMKRAIRRLRHPGR